MKNSFSSLRDFNQFFLSYLPGKILCLALLAAAPLVLGSCSGSAIGGIGLDAPVADLEGGTTREAFLCGTADGAVAGNIVRLTNISNAAIPPVEVTLDDSLAYSAEVCMRVGQSTNIQVFDSAGTALSEIRTVSRLPGEDGDECPDPTVSVDQEDCT